MTPVSVALTSTPGTPQVSTYAVMSVDAATSAISVPSSSTRAEPSTSAHSTGTSTTMVPESSVTVVYSP